MRLSFDSIEEVKEFVKGLKGTRGGKAGDADDNPAGAQSGTGGAPPPLQPPQGGQSGTGFPTFPNAGAGTGFPAGPSPEVQALVTRITARIDGAIASGQPADTALQWFRGQCGPEAAQATMEQIKTGFLPKLAVPALQQIASLMNA